MNTPSWFEKHLSEERMIGLLDGELGGRATQSAERHLKSCWTCRHKCEQPYHALLAQVLLKPQRGVH